MCPPACLPERSTFVGNAAGFICSNLERRNLRGSMVSQCCRNILSSPFACPFDYKPHSQMADLDVYPCSPSSNSLGSTIVISFFRKASASFGYLSGVIVLRR